MHSRRWTLSLYLGFKGAICYDYTKVCRAAFSYESILPFYKLVPISVLVEALFFAYCANLPLHHDL
jgi:hypothetical protein